MEKNEYIFPRPLRSITDRILKSKETNRNNYVLAFSADKKNEDY